MGFLKRALGRLTTRFGRANAAEELSTRRSDIQRLRQASEYNKKVAAVPGQDGIVKAINLAEADMMDSLRSAKSAEARRIAADASKKYPRLKPGKPSGQK
ncbi:MAG: hypothetical protein NUV57_02970 [archaeon]|nr:hypothetical protein [archaeon]